MPLGKPSGIEVKSHTSASSFLPDKVNALGGSLNTTKKNIEALVVTSNC